MRSLFVDPDFGSVARLTDLVTSRIACDILNCSKSSLLLYRRKGLPHFQITTKRFLYRISDLLDWLEKRRVG